LSDSAPRCTQGDVAASLRGGRVPVHGALPAVLATGAASRTPLGERRRPLGISTPILLARVHLPRH